MPASGWPITLQLISLLVSVTSSPVSIHTPTPPFPSHVSPPSPSPTMLPSQPPPPPSFPPPIISSSAESTEKVSCPLMMSPSAVVVRFGDPVTANCSVQQTGFSLLGWEVSLAAPEATMDRFLVWSVESMTEWSIKPMCYALSEQGGQCHIDLPLLVYKPPDAVSISLVNHTGPMSEGRQYALQCAVWDAAPVQNLVVTFYRGQTALGQLQPDNCTEKQPATEIFTLNISPSKEDDGVQYWCEARLELGAAGPQPPLVVTSQKYTAAVLFGPHLLCPTKLQVREGDRLSCEVRGNPEPSVTWFRDGQVVVLPSRPGREHAGKYTVLARGLLEQRNFTVEVEVLANFGAANGWNGRFLLAVLLIQTNIWL